MKKGYGWIYSRRVTYSCRQQNLAWVVPDISPSGVNTLSDTPVVVGEGISDNNNTMLNDLSESINLERYQEDYNGGAAKVILKSD